MEDSTNIWAQASSQFIEANTVESKRLGERGGGSSRDVNQVFVGSAQSGKTSLIHAYLSSIAVGEVKEGASIDTVTSRLSSSIEQEVHGLVEYYCLELKAYTLHVYEISGGAKLASQLDSIITPSNIQHTMVYICVDGSNPASCVDHSGLWQQKIKQRIHSCFQDLASRGRESAVVPQRQMKLTASLLADGHADKGALKPTPIPVCVLLTKFDVFNKYNAHGSAVQANTAAFQRYFCHRNGQSLLYTALSFKSALKVLQNRTTRFSTDQYYAGKQVMPLQTDHTKPLSVFFGSDSYQSILQSGANGLTVNMTVDLLASTFRKNIIALAQTNADLSHLNSKDLELALSQALDRPVPIDQSVWAVMNAHKEVAALLGIDTVVERAADNAIDRAVAEAAVFISRAKQDAMLAEKIREKENQIAFAST